MNFNKYQDKARETAIYPNIASFDGLIYCVLGLAGESGEVAENAKKAIRDDQSSLTGERRERIIGELGDVLWYVSNCASELGVSLDDIAARNVNKLASRKARGKLNGDGDNR